MDAKAEIAAAIDQVRLEEQRPQASAQKNKWAEDECWKGAQLSAEGFHLGQEKVQLNKLASGLEEVLRRVVDLEYKLEIHVNTLDELAHRL